MIKFKSIRTCTNKLDRKNKNGLEVHVLKWLTFMEIEMAHLFWNLTTISHNFFKLY